MRVPILTVGWEAGGGMSLMASVMVGCLDAALTAGDEGRSGRLSQAGVRMFRQRGAWIVLSVERRQFSGLVEERSVLKYLSA